jgi:photosystem II stability/assembly factor-like uncharacterized protein
MRARGILCPFWLLAVILLAVPLLSSCSDDDEGGPVEPPVKYVWSPMLNTDQDDLYGLWGTSGDNVYAVGDNGTILHWDGTSWSAVPSNTGEVLRKIWGASNTNIYAVGNNRTIVYYNGNTWTPWQFDASPDVPSEARFINVWGSSEDNVFVVGSHGVIVHWDGQDWERMPTELDQTPVENRPWLYGVWGSSPDTVFAAGNPYTANPDPQERGGTVLLKLPAVDWIVYNSSMADYRLEGISGTSFFDVFFVGMNSEILYFQNNMLVNWDAVFGGPGRTLYNVWMCEPGRAIAVGHTGTISQLMQTSWSAMTSGTTNNLYGVWGTSCTDIFAAGAGGIILRYGPE